MISGVFTNGKEVKQEARQAVKVKAVESIALDRQTILILSGVTKAEKTATLRPEVAGAVSKVYAKDGEYLKAGDIILKIDEENRRKLHEQAHSELQSAKIQFEAARVLYEKKLSSKNHFIEAKSKLSMAEAAFERARLAFEKTSIRAPFDGYIDTIKVKEGDYISTSIGSIVGQFSSFDKLIATFYVPHCDLDSIQESSDAIIITIGGKKITGRITFIGKVAEQDTRTFPVEVTIDNGEHALRIGETVTAELLRKVNGNMHYIPKSSIVLDADGKIGVKVLDDRKEVMTKNISIEDEDKNGFWISGLNDKECIITVGAAAVTDGEKVQVN
jgi:multidrug efflux system membrane fusion protein